MTQAQVSERLIKRIRWLGGSDPTWSKEDGRPPTAWAVEQALRLLDRVAQAGQPYQSEPQVTATARGGIEFLWKGAGDRELDVVLPPREGLPIEIAWAVKQDGSTTEVEREALTIDDTVAVIVHAVS